MLFVLTDGSNSSLGFLEIDNNDIKVTTTCSFSRMNSITVSNEIIYYSDVYGIYELDMNGYKKILINFKEQLQAKIKKLLETIW